MIKKMRRRFIWVAMIAFLSVMLLVAAVINLGNYTVTAVRQDQVIERIYEYNREEPPEIEERDDRAGRAEETGSEHFEQRHPEAAYSIRFFIVRYEGDETSVFRDFIATVTEEEARAYGETILEKGRERGYYRRYRYGVYETEEGKTVIFLNSDDEISFLENLLITSVLVVMVSLMVVFVLIFLLSKRAIAPFAKNMERQKRFITDAGHELKTPVTSISTSADVLEVLYGENEWTENIQKQVVRMAKLVENLVTLSRLDEETPFPQKEVFSLSEAAWESVEPFSALAKARGKTFASEIQEGICLYGDRASIQQMISILLDNGVKYSDEGGSIRFSLRKRHGRTYIELENTCLLEENEDLNHLFERFYRPDTSRSRTTGGTGIGLSIARAVAEAHGGQISARRREENWICFQVVL